MLLLFASLNKKKIVPNWISESQYSQYPPLFQIWFTWQNSTDRADVFRASGRSSRWTEWQQTMAWKTHEAAFICCWLYRVITNATQWTFKHCDALRIARMICVMTNVELSASLMTWFFWNQARETHHIMQRDLLQSLTIIVLSKIFSFRRWLRLQQHAMQYYTLFKWLITVHGVQYILLYNDW